MRLRTAIEIGIEGERERASVLLELGSVSHRAGKATDALEAFASAAEIARALDSAELLARAAIGYEDAGWRPGGSERDAVELLEEALTAVDEESAELRIGLLAGLAERSTSQGEHERGGDRPQKRHRAGQATRRSRGAGEGAGSLLLVARDDPAGGDPLMLTEARDLARSWRTPRSSAEAMAWRVPTFVALGDIESARAEIVGAARDGRAHGAAVHEPRRRALRVGDRSL